MESKKIEFKKYNGQIKIYIDVKGMQAKSKSDCKDIIIKKAKIIISKLLEKRNDFDDESLYIIKDVETKIL